MTTDWPRYRKAEDDEWEARKRNPVLVQVDAYTLREAKQALMLLRRVQGNTKDLDLRRVEDGLVPLLHSIESAFRALPEVHAAINEQREVLGLEPVIGS